MFGTNRCQGTFGSYASHVWSWLAADICDHDEKYICYVSFISGANVNSLPNSHTRRLATHELRMQEMSLHQNISSTICIAVLAGALHGDKLVV